MKTFNTPILFLVFNRPDTAKLVFEKIRAVQPTKLYIAADGARANREGEEKKVNEVREICNNVDWDCEVHTLYRENNLGCGKAVSEAITWFFEHVEEGIILEDDCLPDESFFKYCSFLLNEYRLNKTVFHIGGSNFQFGQKRGDGDYYYSALSHVWGWATWRRAWNFYQFDLNKSNSISDIIFNNAFNGNVLFINYYKSIFSQMRNAAIDTWDYQWLHANILNKGLSITPNVNLVKNIGFREDATHTLEEIKWNTENDAVSIKNFKKPSLFKIDIDADEYTLREIVGIREYVAPFSKVNFLNKLLNKLNKKFNF